MESRRGTQSSGTAHGSHTARKVMPLYSEMGTAILKGNVFEDSKLENEIDRLNHWQKKQASRLRWEQEYLMKRKKHVLQRGSSDPDLVNLPPISNGLRKFKNEKKRIASLGDYSSCGEDSSPDRSPFGSLEELRVKPRVSSVSPRINPLNLRAETTTLLPALISPRFVRKRYNKNCMKDPRFSSLIHDLVPRTEGDSSVCGEQRKNKSGSSVRTHDQRPGTPRPTLVTTETALTELREHVDELDLVDASAPCGINPIIEE